ncbi:putative ABC transporter substrate-binding lipoprotein YvrC [Halobacillus andaensis]|uniref:ABC transporter substrate-binding lipoprotein YvrC n=1 Tax=Halobacillus andaensis TaxID=1176239 RepID=A0A917B9R4_HALAA|nr:ABC transporter substrate-binding protein [Halobacillus andaensis]MBP2005181.1 iron complex transport system substrate-binding protein [Halobacillus andaensis]GGF29492.1 putative ABC transporter substrate-binding lipoprotein YvrC [Halobacillus andaensis]
MKKYWRYIGVACLSAGLLVGCAEDSSEESNDEAPEESNEEASGETSYPLTIEDAMENEVEIEEDPERIVSLMPSNTEIAFELGAGDEVVGVSENDNYPEEVTELEQVGGMEINVEKVISLEPDLVLAHASSAHNSQEALDQIEEAGIAVYIVEDAASFDGVYDTIEAIGEVVNEQGNAEEIVTGMQKDIEAIEEQAAEVEEEKRVFVEVSPEPEIYTTGTGTFMNEMLEMIQAENAAADEEGWVQMNEEAVIDMQPDTIITTYGYYTEDPVEQVLSREGWEEVPAIENAKVIDVHSDLVTRSGPRLVEGLEELAEAVYPDTFGDE